MKRIVVGLAGVLLLGSSVCQAGESDGEKAFKSYADVAVGGVWKATRKQVELKDDEWRPTGEVAELVDEYRWIADKRFLQLNATKNGKRRDRVAVLGVDPETKQFTWWRFTKFGFYAAPCTQDKDGNWIFQGTFTNPEGQEMKWKNRLWSDGKDTLRLEHLESFVDGEKVAPRPSPIWTRHEGTIGSVPLEEGTEDTEGTSPTEGGTVVSAYGEFMVGGVWKGIGIDGKEGAHQYRWVAGKTFVQLTLENPTGATGFLGVNPKTDQATWWWFRKSGMMTTTVQTEKPGVWILRSVFPNDEEKRVASKYRVSMVADDKVCFEQVELTIDGTAAEPSPPQTWTRHKK